MSINYAQSTVLNYRDKIFSSFFSVLQWTLNKKYDKQTNECARQFRILFDIQNGICSKTKKTLSWDHMFIYILWQGELKIGKSGQVNSFFFQGKGKITGRT